MVDVDGAWFHSYQGPGAEVKEHLSCNRRRVLVSTARQQSHLATTLRRSITTNGRRQYRRSSGTTITQAHSSYINGNRFSALAPSPSLSFLRPPHITIFTQPPPQQQQQQQQDVAANQRSLPPLLRRARPHGAACPPSQHYQTCSLPRLLLLKIAIQHAVP
jgi:hypothetical protein